MAAGRRDLPSNYSPPLLGSTLGMSGEVTVHTNPRRNVHRMLAQPALQRRRGCGGEATPGAQRPPMLVSTPTAHGPESFFVWLCSWDDTMH